jgi:hypothetical protein
VSKLLDVNGMLDERESLQRGVHQFVETWHEGMKFAYEGADLGQCLEYNLTQLLNHRVLAELEKEQARRSNQ